MGYYQSTGIAWGAVLSDEWICENEDLSLDEYDENVAHDGMPDGVTIQTVSASGSIGGVYITSSRVPYGDAIEGKYGVAGCVPAPLVPDDVLRAATADIAEALRVIGYDRPVCVGWIALAWGG